MMCAICVVETSHSLAAFGAFLANLDSNVVVDHDLSAVVDITILLSLISLFQVYATIGENLVWHRSALLVFLLISCHDLTPFLVMGMLGWE